MSVHGTVMIAVALIAIIGGPGNYLLPLMVGAVWLVLFTTVYVL